MTERSPSPRLEGFTASVALLAALAAGCSPAADDPTGQAQEAQVVCPGASTLQGVDVSEYQGNVDWNAVAGTGLSFAIARVGDGSYVDPYFDGNWAGIKNAGLVRGVYQFFEPGEDPIAQADILINHVGSLGYGDLPPVLDMEVTGGQSPGTINAHIHAWVDHVQGALGRAPMIYTGKYFWNDHVGTGDFAGNPLWLAAYVSPCPDTPNAWGSWTMWQFQDNGHFNGIGGGVDTSLFNGDAQALGQLAGQCAARCAGNVLVHDDCSQQDCSAGWGACSEQGGPHCIPGYDAVFVGQGSDAAPDPTRKADYRVCAGQDVSFWFELKDVGYQAWSDSNDPAPGKSVRLGTTDPPNHNFADPLTGGSRVSVSTDANSAVSPGGPDCSDKPGCNATVFTIAGKAPSLPGVYKTSWQLVDEQQAWFGPVVWLTFDVACGVGDPTSNGSTVGPPASTSTMVGAPPVAPPGSSVTGGATGSGAPSSEASSCALTSHPSGPGGATLLLLAASCALRRRRSAR